MQDYHSSDEDEAITIFKSITERSRGAQDIYNAVSYYEHDPNLYKDASHHDYDDDISNFFNEESVQDRNLYGKRSPIFGSTYQLSLYTDN